MEMDNAIKYEAPSRLAGFDDNVGLFVELIERVMNEDKYKYSDIDVTVPSSFPSPFYSCSFLTYRSAKFKILCCWQTWPPQSWPNRTT